MTIAAQKQKRDGRLCRNGFHQFSRKKLVAPVYSQCVSFGDTSIGPPRGLTTFGVFLLWGAAMATLAGVTLLWRGTVLDSVWSLNPRAYHELAPFGSKAGILMLMVAVVLSIAGFGWFHRRQWAWWLAVAIIATQITGDLINLFLGRVLEGGVGIAVAGVLLLYLLRRSVRGAFGT